MQPVFDTGRPRARVLKGAGDAIHIMEADSTTRFPIRIDRSFEDLPIEDGVDTRSLRPGDLLSIQTLNSIYTLRLDEPSRGRGTACGNGEFINDESDASLIGATLTGRGSMVKVGWILLGFKVVFSIPGGELMTSKVRGIAINGKPLMPPVSRTH